LSQLQLRNTDEVYILGILSKSNLALTINLKSPLIVNATRRIGCQAITSDDQPLAFPLPQPQLSRVISEQKRAA
jgi:flagellar assembly factor FliW